MAHNSQSMFASMASKLFELLALTRSRLRLAKQATPASPSDFNAYGSTIISPGTHTSTTIRLPSSISTSACHLTELLSARTPVDTLPHPTAGCAPEPTSASKGQCIPHPSPLPVPQIQIKFAFSVFGQNLNVGTTDATGVNFLPSATCSATNERSREWLPKQSVPFVVLCSHAPRPETSMLLRGSARG
ncbi:similar to An08g12150 [Aspergillus luchuensis]|uniref:Similar to An08g12150 n=1 Tax=Aspergillus kawachii TaxID=1069201 RepID=A0A146F9S4_ASPKA|nr:similar to An08g12150 [Aspergillus luchuensis]